MEGGIKGSRLSSLAERWVYSATGAKFCNRFRAANQFIWSLPINVKWQEGTGFYEVCDTTRRDAFDGLRPQRIHVRRRERIMRYRRGVADRIDRLARKYFIDRVPLNDDDVVVDCGANVGEIGLHVGSRAAVNYIAIEPSVEEADACDLNAFGGERNTHRTALWCQDGRMTFYEKNASADSSLIAPGNHTGKTSVTARKLDSLVTELGLEGIHLLKVEGEGAEPEILAGGTATLARTTYCTIDCGPERGASEAHVIAEVCNHMLGCNFEVVDVNLERQIFLFRNRSAT